MEISRKYGVQTDIYFPLIVAGGRDFAGSSDYTYAAGDIKISKDGAAAANPTNSPSAITMGNGAMWKLTLTATELQAKKIMFTLVDATTKAVEDQMLLITTYGHASAEHPFDLGTDILTAQIAEPGAAFTWPGTIGTILGWLGALARNKRTQTSTTQVVRNDADSANISTSAVSDDGSTATRGEWT